MIYHYTTFEKALLYILPSLKLRSNFLSKTNDPKEFQGWAISGRNIPFDRLYSDINLIQAQFNLGNYFRDIVQVICFSGKKYGQINSTMWAHYSGNHSGICFEIDEKKFLNENKDLLNVGYKYKNVDYIDKYSSVHINWDRTKSDKENISIIPKKYSDYLYFRKDKIWECENEFRLIILNKNDYQLLSIKNSLKSIYLGVSFPKECYCAVNDLKKKQGFAVYECFPEINKRKLDFIERGDDEKQFILKKYLRSTAPPRIE